MNDRKTLLARIEGRVQGVWYRGWTVEQARARGLSGWVRNRRDGSVEACFHGPPHVVDDMIRACHDGPPAARVESVNTEAVEHPPSEGFTQRSSA